MRLLSLLLLAPILLVPIFAVSAQETPTASPTATPDGNVWVSLDSSSSQLSAPSGGYSYAPSISADGNFIAFQSSGNFVREGDANDVEDVFRRDVALATTTLVSLGNEGQQGNNRSGAPDITADGAVVVFESLATNLVPGDNNNASDIYLRNLIDATTVRISLAPDGTDANAGSIRPAISSDGNYIAFCSRATNLVAAADGIAASAFLYERATGAITRVPLDDGTEATAGCAHVAINNDGSVMAVASLSGGASRVYAYDRATGTTTPLTETADGSSGLSGLSISGDGNLVAFDAAATNLVPEDTNRSHDVFVANIADGTVKRVSVRSTGSQLPADSGVSGVAISGDGRFVVFGTAAGEVVPGDSNAREDIFRHELASGETTIASVSSSGRPANDSSYAPAVNTDASVVAFASLAANIVPGDSNRYPDVFIRATTFLASDGDAGPVDTGARDDDASQEISTDEDNTPLLYAGGGIAGAVLVLVAMWFILGRRGRA
jgi:hypothetical protein